MPQSSSITNVKFLAAASLLAFCNFAIGDVRETTNYVIEGTTWHPTWNEYGESFSHALLCGAIVDVQLKRILALSSDHGWNISYIAYSRAMESEVRLAQAQAESAVLAETVAIVNHFTEYGNHLFAVLAKAYPIKSLTTVPAKGDVAAFKKAMINALEPGIDKTFHRSRYYPNCLLSHKTGSRESPTVNELINSGFPESDSLSYSPWMPGKIERWESSSSIPLIANQFITGKSNESGTGIYFARWKASDATLPSGFIFEGKSLPLLEINQKNQAAEVEASSGVSLLDLFFTNPNIILEGELKSGMFAELQAQPHAVLFRKDGLIDGLNIQLDAALLEELTWTFPEQANQVILQANAVQRHLENLYLADELASIIGIRYQYVSTHVATLAAMIREWTDKSAFYKKPSEFCEMLKYDITHWPTPLSQNYPRAREYTVNTPVELFYFLPTLTMKTRHLTLQSTDIVQSMHASLNTAVRFLLITHDTLVDFGDERLESLSRLRRSKLSMITAVKSRNANP